MRFKIVYEMGNPVISNMYLRFALDSIKIHYDTYVDDVPVNATFETSVPEKMDGAASYIYSNNSGTETYKCISEPLDITVNPISYTMCPLENEVGMMDITGTIMKKGSASQVTKGMRFYENSYYGKSMLFSTAMGGSRTAADIRKDLLYVWDALKVKGKYIQDNIVNLNVASKEFDMDRYDDSHKMMVMLNSSGLTETMTEIDYIKGNKYASIVYNSSIMHPKLRNDDVTFYYNNETFKAIQYNQYNNGVPVPQKEDMNMPVRSMVMLDSMDVWNFEYQNSERHNTDIVYRGNVNQYGNGYMYLDASVDSSQYNEMGILPLQQVVAYNDSFIYDSSVYMDIDVVVNDQYEPQKNGYYRTFLYDFNWEYPYCKNNAIYPYQIVSDFDYLLWYMMNSNMAVPQCYQQRMTELTDKSTYLIPYTEIFDITPRVACNTDCKTTNVFMLRRPSIGTDCDDRNDVSTSYNLDRHYFELGEG